MAVSLADGYAEVFKDGQPTEELIDLKGAREATPRTVSLARGGDVLAVEKNTAGVWFQRSCDQIHQSCFAGPVWPDERAARTAFEREVDVARHRQGTKSPVQSFDLQSGGHGCFLFAKYSAAFSNRPRIPRRANRTARTSIRPMPNCQKVGLNFEK